MRYPMLHLIALAFYSYHAIPFMMDTIGMSLLASVTATIISYFVVIGMILGYRPDPTIRTTRYYDRWDDRWDD